jgi:hypothetical protein
MRIFICSPLRGDFEGNIKKAKEYCRRAALDDHNPLAPHLYYTQFLDEFNEDERNLGIKLGIELIDMCDEIWAYCDDYHSASSGMKQEIEYAILIAKKKVIYKGAL